MTVLLHQVTTPLGRCPETGDHSMKDRETLSIELGNRALSELWAEYLIAPIALLEERVAGSRFSITGYEDEETTA